jgi:hypothetical protein
LLLKKAVHGEREIGKYCPRKRGGALNNVLTARNFGGNYIYRESRKLRGTIETYSAVMPKEKT